MAAIESVALATLLVASTFAMGLEVKWSRPTRTSFLPLVVAVLINLMLLPAVAWALVSTFSVPGPAARGILLCALAPAGGTASLFVVLAGADAPFAATLMLSLAAASVVSVPLQVHFFFSGTTDISGTVAYQVLPTLLAFQLLPLAVGVVLGRWRPALADSIKRHVARFAAALLGAILLMFVVTRGHLVFANGFVAVVVSVALGAAALFSGHLAPAGHRTRIASAFVTSVRNLSLALVLAAQITPGGEAVLAILVYGLVMYVLAGALVWRERSRAVHVAGIAEGRVLGP